MIPVGPYPILLHIMRIYAHHGFNDFIVCLGYKSELVKDYFRNLDEYVNDFTMDFSRPPGQRITVRPQTARAFRPRVTLAYTGLATMTGARIKRVADYIDGDDFMITYGDGVAD